MSKLVDDGLVYDVDGLSARAIREDQQHGGIRLKTVANLGKTRIPIVVDVGFGDATIDPHFRIDYPSLLDNSAVRVRAYPPASVIAEKFHAIVTLGFVNSRMKDYYDLWALLGTHSLEETDLATAIATTFGRRETEIPSSTPAGLTEQFSVDPLKVQQWRAYSSSIDLEGVPLKNVTDLIWSVMEPACERVRHGT